MWELVKVSRAQLDAINKYIAQTDEKDLPSPDKREEYQKQILYYLNILETFDNCPQKAAMCRNLAVQKAEAASEEIYDAMLAHIPKPIKDNFYSSFDTIEEANTYWDLIEEKAGKVFREVIDKEFHSIYFDYKWNQLETPQTVN